ncbi:MAG: NAD(P)H-dependent glycerol-3-phosphate dehydrogenase [Hyphomonadaceae bacterium]
MTASPAPRALNRIGVLGAGAWGTALAQVAALAGRDVTLWALEPETAAAINAQRENTAFLPGISLDARIRATNDLAALAQCDGLLAAAPAQHLGTVLTQLAPVLRQGAPATVCAKGVERGSLRLMTEVLAQAAPQVAPAVLSGPGFAGDVARGLPTAVTLAAADPALGKLWVDALGLATFRPYLSDDMIGCQIGGAVKNVIAIACGVAEGRGLGEGARAALITRGFAEMTRLGLALGGRAETMSGLCGLGDLVLTCASRTSRNMSFGYELGQGRAVGEILSQRRSVAEGAESAPAIAALAERAHVEMPICQAVNAVLNGTLSVDAAITALLMRPFRAEGR